MSMNSDAREDGSVELDVLSLDEGRLEKAEAELQKYIQQPLTKENYSEFVRDLRETIDDKREALHELLQMRRDLEAEREEILEAFGEENLDDLRDEGEGRWNFDLLQLAKIDRKLKRQNEKLFEHAMVMKALERVGRVRLATVMDEFEGQRLQAEVYRRLEETMEKEREFMRQVLESQESTFKDQMQDIREDQRETRKMVYEGLRMNAEALEAVGGQLDELEGLTVSSMDEDSGGADDGSASDRGDGSLKESIIEDLQAKQAGELEKTQNEIAEDHDTDPGYVSRVKREAEEDGIL